MEVLKEDTDFQKSQKCSNSLQSQKKCIRISFVMQESLISIHKLKKYLLRLAVSRVNNIFNFSKYDLAKIIFVKAQNIIGIVILCNFEHHFIGFCLKRIYNIVISLKNTTHNYVKGGKMCINIWGIVLILLCQIIDYIECPQH